MMILIYNMYFCYDGLPGFFHAIYGTFRHKLHRISLINSGCVYCYTVVIYNSFGTLIHDR